MARRRLTPTIAPAGAGTDVPRAERSGALAESDAGPFGRLSPAAPIARVAAEAASAAALDELTETLRTARETGRLVIDLPTDQIAPDHLARDRIPADDEDMVALCTSIREHGQRAPIEVTPLSGSLPYGLISGWRRLAAIQSLHAETGDPRFATIQALVRRPETARDAYVAMVEENEIRIGLSQYERARVAALAAERGVFSDEETALKALFASASRPKRSRIRAFLEIYHALDGVLRFPAHLPERLGLRLVERLRTGEGTAIAAALAGADPQTADAELAALEIALAPASGKTKRPLVSRTELRPGVALESHLKGHTLTVKLTGKGVTAELEAEVRAALVQIGQGG